jgi:hypothetical protein
LTSEQRLYLDRKGNIIDCEDAAQRMTSWDLLYYLERANFDGVKSDYLLNQQVPEKKAAEGKVPYEFGRLVTGAREVGDNVEVAFEDTRSSSEGSNGRPSAGTGTGHFKQIS